jgi:hypothetical protein
MNLDLRCVSRVYEGRAEQHTNLGQDLVLLGLCLGHCAR